MSLFNLTPQQQLASLYVMYYDRAPDPNGFGFWETLLVESIQDNDPDADGQTLQEIAAQFSTAPETFATYDYYDPNASVGELEFVSDIYSNLFGRMPDAGGLEYWAGRLESGSVSDGEILLEMADTALTNNPNGQDAQFLQNKIEAGLYWKDAAANAGLTKPDSPMDGADAAIQDVTEDPETVTTSQFKTDAQFDTMTTIRLTSGEDRGVDFIGDGVDNTFDASLTQNPAAGGVSNTLSSGDQLNGAGGTDTLEATLVPELVSGGFLPLDVQPTTTSIENIEIEARDGFRDDGGGTAENGRLSSVSSDVEITLDAKDMTGIERIGSHFSDGDLKVENLTTLTSDGQARNT